MSLQIQIQKALNQFNFLSTTMYDRHDLTNLIKQNEKFVVRQGDLVITNYDISDRRKRGLRYARMEVRNGIWIFGINHHVIGIGNETVLIHPEHGVVVVPENREKLNFYTFAEGGD